MTTPATAPEQLVTVPARRMLPRLARNPMRTFEDVGHASQGALTRLSLGPTRPYLVTHPEHVRQVLLNIDTYRREGMLWKEIQRLEGDGFAGEGAPWRRSRRMLQPLLSPRSVGTMVGVMASAVDEALDAVEQRADSPLNLVAEMTRITHRVLIRVFFSSEISLTEADRLGAAINTALRSLSWRMLLPFVSDSVPLPGDRAFRRSVATIDRTMYPLIRSYRDGSRGGQVAAGRPEDFLAMFANAVDEDGEPMAERRVRDDVVAMFVAGTETTAMTLSWLFLLLDRHPETAERLVQEATEVVGGDRLTSEHLPRLVHTRMALQETMRLYPSGWLIPRRVAQPDRIGGTDLRTGDEVLLSPFLTHRLQDFWDDPYAFRPERFADDQEWKRHKFAYIPFSAGAHQCLGNHFSLAEAQLAVAGVLSRFRLDVVKQPRFDPRLTAVLQPRGRPRVTLRPR